MVSFLDKDLDSDFKHFLTYLYYSEDQFSVREARNREKAIPVKPKKDLGAKTHDEL